MKYAIIWMFLLGASTVFLFAWQETAVSYFGKSTVEAISWSLFFIWIGMAILGWQLQSRKGGNAILYASVGFLAFFLIRLVSATDG